MKRYILFAGDSYYPGGGWTDFISAGDNLEEMKATLVRAKRRYNWAHIADIETLEIVWEE